MCKRDKPNGTYVLFIKTIDDSGDVITRHYDRNTGIWTPTQSAALGYTCCAIARRELARREKRGFGLPKAETCAAWGYEWVAL